MNDTAEWLRRRLPELVAEHGVVGAQLVVLVDGEIHDATAGVLNTGTRAPVTSGSLFQIASITKIWTATLVQELVNENRLDLDRPVRDVLPDFRLADEQAARVVTPRHLLTHTAGFEGDLFFDTGTGDDAVEKFVALLAGAEQVTPPGERWSYCNSGFAVLGRIVEVLRGKPFNTVLRERLATPLGLTVETTILRGPAIADGHLDGEPVAGYGPVSDFPVGSALAMSARDLLAFVRMHLGTPGLAAMREPQVELPDPGEHCSWGLGWMVLDAVDGTVIGHNGGNKGLASFLRVVPETGVAIALLTNGGSAQPVFDAAFAHLSGVRLHESATPHDNAERVESTAEWITRRLPELIEEHGIVGAQVAVLHNGEIVDAAAGVLDNATNEKVSADAIFQIGSITKVWTATLVQELVNEGLLDLDRPVRDVLPEFRLADEQAARIITPRQLLCHTAGFEGDLFHDTGSGDDMLEKYLELMAQAKQETPPGELHSYCNSGFVVLGRIVEVVRGKPFNTVLRERLVDRLGLRTAATRLGEYTGAATGHLPEDGALKPVEKPMTEADAPAGSVLAMSARELLEFVRMHLGTHEFDAMRETQVVPPDFGFGGRQGLGWILHDYDNGLTGAGHTGQTLGFLSYLRVIPEKGLAVSVLTNGGAALPLARAVYEKVFGELANVTLKTFPKPPEIPVPVDVEKVVGVYQAARVHIHVTPGDQGRVKVRCEPRDDAHAELVDTGEYEYTGLRGDALIGVEKESGYHPVLVLCGRDEEGRVRWLHYGRAAVRR